VGSFSLLAKAQAFACFVVFYFSFFFFTFVRHLLTFLGRQAGGDCFSVFADVEQLSLFPLFRAPVL
jgi:hypothetical protein